MLHRIVVLAALLLLPLAGAAKEPKHGADRELEVIESHHFNIPEISGMCWRRDPHSKQRQLVIVGDKTHSLYVVNWDDRQNGKIEEFPLAELVPDFRKAGSQWESVVADESGRVFILQENPARVFVTSPDLKSIERVIRLEIPKKGFERVAWNKDLNSRGEGLILLKNRNLVANMLQIRAWMMPFLKEGEEVALCPLPMYHVFAFTVHCLALPSIGTLSILVTNARDLNSVIKAMKDYPISLMTGVNTLFNALANHKDFSTVDFSNLKVTVGGAMAVQRPVAEQWQKLTGCPLSEGYGMTEASPVVTTNPLDGTGRLGTIGLPVPSTDVRIVDDHGNILGPNQAGELQVKGPQVMKGYYNSPDQTANTIKDGWLSTGDVATMNDDGFLQIVDRQKDMILVSGFNVYPNEIEEYVASHPKVMECAAIGIPDEKSGEMVKLFIVKKEKSLSEKEVIEFCRTGLTGYKVPKKVEFRDELPKTNVGKILRRQLREEEMAKRKA